ncbi:MAG: hypothetical protein AB4290_18805 [Spirulina sp.]
MVVKFLKHWFGVSPQAPYIRDFLTPNRSSGELPSGIFTVGETGEIVFEFLWHGREISQGQLVLFSLEGLEDFQWDSPAFIREILHRIHRDRQSNAARGYLAIADLTEGARFGSWGARFADDRVQGSKSFKFPVGERFCFALIRKTPLNEVAQNSDRINCFCFSFLPHRFVDVTGEGKIFAFGEQGSLYNSPVFRIWGARGNAIALDDAIAPQLDWRKTPLGKELLTYIQDVFWHACHPSIAVKLPHQTRENSKRAGVIIVGQPSISQGSIPQTDLIPSILAEHLQHLGIYDLIQNEKTSTLRF